MHSAFQNFISNPGLAKCIWLRAWKRNLPKAKILGNFYKNFREARAKHVTEMGLQIEPQNGVAVISVIWNGPKNDSKKEPKNWIIFESFLQKSLEKYKLRSRESSDPSPKPNAFCETKIEQAVLKQTVHFKKLMPLGASF